VSQVAEKTLEKKRKLAAARKENYKIHKEATVPRSTIIRSGFAFDAPLRAASSGHSIYGAGARVCDVCAARDAHSRSSGVGILVAGGTSGVPCPIINYKLCVCGWFGWGGIAQTCHVLLFEKNEIYQLAEKVAGSRSSDMQRRLRRVHHALQGLGCSS